MNRLIIKAFAVGFVLALAVPGFCAGGQAGSSHSGGSLDDVLDTLQHDDGTVATAFRFPDVYGDDFRNQRFRAPDNCTVVGVLFAFGTRHFTSWTTGNPSLVVMAWPMGDDSLPVADAVMLHDTIPFSAYTSSIFQLDSVWHNRPSQFVFVDLSRNSLPMDSGQWFHVGYTATHEAGDSLAILSDDGSPATNFASEFYNGHFVLMRAGWGGVNFMIRPIVDFPSGVTGMLEPDGTVRDFSLNAAYPNPFNPTTTISFDLTKPQSVRLSVIDLLGREKAVLAQDVFGAGRHTVPLSAADWSSGVYFVRLESAGQSRTVKIVLEK